MEIQKKRNILVFLLLTVLPITSFGMKRKNPFPESEYEKDRSKKRQKTGTTKQKNDTCAVCLNKLTSDQNIKFLPCFHKFHRACIDRWLKTNRVCPVCRLNLDEIEHIQQLQRQQEQRKRIRREMEQKEEKYQKTCCF